MLLQNSDKSFIIIRNAYPATSTAQQQKHVNPKCSRLSAAFQMPSLQFRNQRQERKPVFCSRLMPKAAESRGIAWQNQDPDPACLSVGSRYLSFLFSKTAASTGVLLLRPRRIFAKVPLLSIRFGISKLFDFFPNSSSHLFSACV